MKTEEKIRGLIINRIYIEPIYIYSTGCLISIQNKSWQNHVIKITLFRVQSSVERTATVMILFLFDQILGVICMVLCHMSLGLLLSEFGHRIYNVCNDHSTCCAPGGDTGTNESAEVLTGKN